jgi:hypothetical protein
VLLALPCAFGAAVLPCRLSAQASGPVLAVSSDTSVRQLITLRDGSTVLGRITRSWGDSARVESMAGVLVLRRVNVASVKVVPASSIHDGAYWPEDPNATRLFFAPTARMLKKGDGYLANHWLFFMDGYGGVTDRFTLGGTMTLFPSDNFIRNNAYFISPKIGLSQGERFNTAAGVWLGTAPFAGGASDKNSFGIAYGVATWGDPNDAFTVGAGYGFAQGKLARNPVAMIGGTRRLSRRLSFVTENWLAPNSMDHPLVSAGFRTIGEGLSWDFGVVTVFPSPVFIPWFGAAWKF